MTGHPDADVLARFREDLLGRRRSARIRAHLAGCDRCAALEQGLGEVSTLLAAAPVPPMPDELAARLDRVLAAESAARAGAQAPGGAKTPGGAETPDGAETPGAASPAPGPRRHRSGRPERSPAPDRSTRPARGWLRPAQSRPRAPQSRPRPALRAAAGAAAVLVIAAGGYGVSRLVSQGGSSGAAAAGPRAGLTPARHAAAGSGASARTAKNSFGTSQGGLPAGNVKVVRSGTNYQPGKLAAQADTVLARRSGGSAAQPPLPANSPAAAVAGCVRHVAGGAQPLLVDLARYQGQAATIIVQAPAGGRPGQVWVVGAGCSAHTKDVLARALLTGSG